MKSAITLLVVVAAVLCSTNAFAVPQIVTVSVTGSGADYSSVGAALNSITDASASKPYEIFVNPGIYTGANNGGNGLPWKSYVSLRGADRDSTIIKGSATYMGGSTALLDFSGVQGVEVGNITIDGSAQMAIIGDGNGSGSLCVGGASITFSHVRLVNGEASYSNGFTLNSVTDYCYPGSNGNVTVLDSDIGGVAEAGGNWTFKNTSILATHGAGDQQYLEYIFAYARVGSEYSGNVTFIGCTIEARATVTSPYSETNPIWMEGSGAGEIRIIGSTVIANNDTSSPAGVTAAILNEASASGTKIIVQGSELRYVSHAGVSSGEFNGVYQVAGSNVPVALRASSIHSSGSGGERADIDNDSSAANVVVESTEHSTATGDSGTTTSDVRQGQFSSDLIVPLTSPTLGPVNGQIWIDTGTNKLCYRSGGTTRCILGS